MFRQVQHFFLSREASSSPSSGKFNISFCRPFPCIFINCTAFVVVAIVVSIIFVVDAVVVVNFQVSPTFLPVASFPSSSSPRRRCRRCRRRCYHRCRRHQPSSSKSDISFCRFIPHTSSLAAPPLSSLLSSSLSSPLSSIHLQVSPAFHSVAPFPMHLHQLQHVPCSCHQLSLTIHFRPITLPSHHPSH